MRGTLPSAVAVLAAGVLLSACGAVTRDTQQRPPVPTVVSVSVSKNSIEVTPRAVGVPERSPVNINQNRTAPENQVKRNLPLPVTVVISNLVPRDTKLILEGPAGTIEPLTASASGDFNRALPTGVYRFRSPASSGTARLVVGPSRVSASGSVLTP